MRVLKVIKRMDENAYSLFENLTVFSKSMIMGGLVGSILVAICSVIAGVYILCNGYTLESGEIFKSFVDRSAALPAIAAFICLISEISSKNIK